MSLEEGIAAVVAEAEAALDGITWPTHELDAPVTPQEKLTLYLGSAGMIWALRRLGSSLDVDALAADALQHFRALASPENLSSLFVGETGLLLLTRSDDERLVELGRANERNPTWELLWGSPGTILAAEAAGFEDEARRSQELLAGEWERVGDLWTQDLFGREFRMLGPAHGFAGNVHALRGYVPEDELRTRVERVLREYAEWDADTVNWPPEPGQPPDRMQWCHGAPGIVTTLGDLMPDDLLLAGAEATWRYGPNEKGPGLCHGTAGNGYALLRTYGLTGDERWLERAHSFAEAAFAQRQGRYSLMTGDIGAALFAQACLDRDARFPIMDVL